MQVYIEIILFDNFIIDWILLYVTAKTLNLKKSKLRFNIAAAFGAVFALAMPLLLLPDFYSAFIKFIGGAVIVFIAFGYRRTSKFLLRYMVFAAYTFIMGGAIIGFILIFNGDIYSAATLNYNFIVPVGAVVLSAFFIAIFLIKLVKYIDRKKNLYPFKRKIDVIYNGKTITDYGFIDSGNCVYDGDGVPVTIVNVDLAQKIVGDSQLNDIMLGKYDTKKITKKYYSNASDKKSVMYLLKIDKLLIYSDKCVNTIENIHLGIVFSKLPGLDDCSAILHSGLIT